MMPCGKALFQMRTLQTRYCTGTIQAADFRSFGINRTAIIQCKEGTAPCFVIEDDGIFGVVDSQEFFNGNPCIRALDQSEVPVDCFIRNRYQTATFRFTNGDIAFLHFLNKVPLSEKCCKVLSLLGNQIPALFSAVFDDFFP